MTLWPHAVVLITPIELQAQANELANTFDPDAGGASTFGSVRLSATGSEPATHLGANTSAQEGFKLDIDEARTNKKLRPERVKTEKGKEGKDKGKDIAHLKGRDGKVNMKEKDVMDVFEQMTVRVNEDFWAACEELGLKLIEQQE